MFFLPMKPVVKSIPPNRNTLIHVFVAWKSLSFEVMLSGTVLLFNFLKIFTNAYFQT